MKSESDRSITIEDILRLKRAERPPTEFWATFDRELRAKQLSALVAKRPWWQTIPRALPLLFRYRMALGASAAIALTVVALRERSTPSDSHALEVASAVPAAPSMMGPQVAAAVIEDKAFVAERPVVVAASTAESVALDVNPPSGTEPVPEVRAIVALGGGMKLDRTLESTSATKLELAANVAVARTTEPSASSSFLAQAGGFEVRPTATRTAVEPLQQMTPPGSSRRTRMLTAMVSSASAESSYSTTERVASRIAEERLYDQIQRFGARGDRLQLKF